jgi:outer membrane receptor for ferric coprogen and ferric-rhodotorulic acid
VSLPSTPRTTLQTVERLPLRPLVLAVMLTFAGALLVQTAPVLAQQTEQHGTRVYALPAGPLSTTLTAISKQAGIALTVSSALVANRSASAVQGTFTTEAALHRALEGSGLMLITTSVGSYSVQAIPQSRSGTQSSLPEITVTGAYTATTEGSGSYATPVMTITKGEQKLKDIPQSVSTLTRQQIDDQGINNLNEAANRITGLVGAKGVGQGVVLSARGFEINAWQYDGVPVPRNMYALGNWGTEDMVFFDRMEVLRGATSLLQGTGSEGGAINLVRKRPQKERTVSITAKAGTWDRYNLQLDAGGPINADGTLRGRIVIDEARSHSFIDYVNNRTRSLYAALDYDITPDTTLGLAISNSDSKGRPMIRGLPLYPDGSDIGLPRSTYVGAWWNRAEIDQTTINADAHHRINNDWKLSVTAMYMREKNTSVHQRMHGVVAADGSGLTYANWATDFDSSRVGLDAFVNGRLNLFGLESHLTVGTNYSRYISNDLHARTFTLGGNIFDINHNRPWQDYNTIMAAGGVDSRTTYNVTQKGLYSSLRVKLSEPLTAVAGVRASWYDYLYEKPSTGAQSIYTASGEITPYAGLVYALNDQWSAYTSYTSVFTPQSARNAAGQVLEPIIGSNYEIGIKGALMDERVNTSLALFRYDSNNRGVNDVDAGMICDGWYCSKPAGKVRSQGIDAEISGEVARGLQVMAGYTYNTTEFLSDPTNKGKTFSQWTPKHMLRIWSNYQLPGSWHQLSIGGGVTTQSSTLGYNREYTMPGFSVWNARIGYQLTSEIALSMNINNLFDKRYYIPGFNETNGNNDYGDPRNVMFTIKYTPKL